MAYKLYKSTTTRNLGLVYGVEVSFELTNSNKENVYTITNLYTSSYKFPISIGLIKRIGDNVNYGYGEGSNLSVLYKLDISKLTNENKFILTYPNMETDYFFINIYCFYNIFH